MSDLHTHIIEILDEHLPESAKATAKELALKIMAEVARHRPVGYGPASTRVPAGELRRPDLPGIRRPGDELGEEAPPT